METEVASTTTIGRSLPGYSAGSQWGLASLMIGSVVFMASPVLLVFNTMFMNLSRGQVPRGLALGASIIGIVTILAIAIASVVFGIRGWLIANRDQQCPALP